MRGRGNTQVVDLDMNDSGRVDSLIEKADVVLCVARGSSDGDLSLHDVLRRLRLGQRRDGTYRIDWVLLKDVMVDLSRLAGDNSREKRSMLVAFGMTMGLLGEKWATAA